jgi:hypothetical protein
MKILGSKRIAMLISIFAIGSFYAMCCGGDDGGKRVEFYIPKKNPKTFTDSIVGSFNKAAGKVATKQFVSVFENFSTAPTRWFGTRYAAICRYAQFRNTNKILRADIIDRLKTLAHEVLEHARANECDYADYIVITKRVQECVSYIKRRLEEAHGEYMRTIKGTRSRSLMQRTAGLVTSSYDVHSIIQIVEWMIADLEELHERSHYAKGFDIDHYKKVICYLQADLDTLFAHLEELV